MIQLINVSFGEQVDLRKEKISITYLLNPDVFCVFYLGLLSNIKRQLAFLILLSLGQQTDPSPSQYLHCF